MPKTLGLDIGTNSIGWCLLEDDTSIIDMGVRIFPVGVKEDDYNKSGSEISKNAARRGARGIRRLYDRYKIRRKQLRKILLEVNMLPVDNMVLSSAELYRLRKAALDEKLSPQELGRVFLLLNQRRGFKSSKKDGKTVEAAKEKSEIKRQMNELEQKVKDSGCRTIGEYFYHLFEQTASETNWRNPDEPIENIRTRFVYRRMYEQEFDMIWDKQKHFYPSIFTGSKKEFDEIKKNVALSFAEKAEKLKIFKKTNYHRIKNACIFYQRPLKSQKHLIGHCRFEPSKRVCPKSSFEFQEFRVWQTISNMRVTHALRFRDKLSLDEKTILAAELNKSQSLSLSKIKKLLNLSVRAVFNDIPDKIRGNYTYAALAEALGNEFWESIPDNRPENCPKEHLHYYQNKYTIWHTLFFANDEEWLSEYAKHKLGLSDEQAIKYVEVNLEPDYSNISTKAILPILAYMKEGHDYAEACEYAGYHHSYDEDKDSAERVLKDKIERNEDDNLRNPLVNQAVSETIRLVNAVMKEHGRPETIRVEFARSLKKPKDIREKMKRNNDEKERKRDSYRDFLKEKLGKTTVTKSDILKYELWLEMGCEQNDIPGFKEFAGKVNTKDEQKYRLWLECNRISPYTSEPISLTKLFSPEIEIEHIIPYSKCMDDSFANKTLSEKAFNERKGNQTPYEYFKGNPEEWEKFKLRIRDFSDSKQAKFTLEEIPRDFLNSQLNNTAYIAVEARKLLKTVCKNVRITNGQATSHLRRFWGLNDILNVDKLNEKSRHDHRHHAIDALVIASTTERYINLLSQQSQFDYTGKMILKDVKFPYPAFKLEATDKINKIFVSYKNKKRLITTKRNKYIHSTSKNHRNETFKGIKSISARGGLHNEHYYGSIEYPHKKSEKYEAGVTYNVIRRKISEIEDHKQLEKVIDLKVREVLTARLNAPEFNGSFKKAFADNPENPIYMYSEKGKKIPLKRVRMVFDKVSIENMIHLPAIKGIRENERLYVSPGDNYMIAIYGDIIPNGLRGDKCNRDYDTITFFNAVQKAYKAAKKTNPTEKESIFPKTKEGKRILFSLLQRDMVVVFEEHPDEIDWNNKHDVFNRMYRVMQFDTNGIIILGKHNLSKINAVRDQKPDVIRCNSNTIRAVKVKITSTGKLVRED